MLTTRELYEAGVVHRVNLKVDMDFLRSFAETVNLKNQRCLIDATRDRGFNARMLQANHQLFDGGVKEFSNAQLSRLQAEGKTNALVHPIKGPGGWHIAAEIVPEIKSFIEALPAIEVQKCNLVTFPKGCIISPHQDVLEETRSAFSRSEIPQAMLLIIVEQGGPPLIVLDRHRRRVEVDANVLGNVVTFDDHMFHAAHERVKDAHYIRINFIPSTEFFSLVEVNT